MIVDKDLSFCRKSLLRYGKFSEANVDEFVILGKNIANKLFNEPTGDDLEDVTAAMVVMSNEGISWDNIKMDIENYIHEIVLKDIAKKSPE